MNAGFTPGPWTLNDREDCGGFRLEDSDESYIGYLESTRYIDERDDPEQVANCHLIAAAPDLYEAGLAVDAWVKDLGGFAEDGTQPAAVFQRLSAALAKARGEVA